MQQIPASLNDLTAPDDFEDVGSYEQVEYVEEVVYEEVEEEVTDNSEEQEQGAVADAGPASVAASTTAAPQEKEPLQQDQQAQLPGSHSAAAGADMGSPPSSQAPQQGDPDWQQLEEKAQRVAQEVKEVSKKLATGLFSAIGNVGEAGTSITKFAGDLTSWWTSLDQQEGDAADSGAAQVGATRHASADMVAHFDLAADESFVEDFKCRLSQVYSCSHNSFTPSIMMSFQGVMYITDQHMCFSVEERAKRLPFKVPHKEISSAQRAPSDKPGDRSDVLRLELRSGGHLAFKDFEQASGLDSALALMEHLMSG